MNRAFHLFPAIATTCLSIVAVPCARSQDSAKGVAESCDRIRCYQPGSVPLTLKDGTEAAFEIKAAVPIISDDVVALLPGTTIFIQGDVLEGKLINLRVVAQPTEVRNVLQIRMWQEPKMADTFLFVTNHFHESIKYRAAMLVPETRDFRATSSCAVLGDGRAGYEHWPHTIVQLVLTDFAFVGADLQEVACE